MTIRKTALHARPALVRGALALVAAALLAAGTAACDDPLGLGDAAIAVDTLTLAAPGGPSADELPSAVDLALGNSPRRPERVSDAGAWDLALRQTAAGFTLLPAQPTGTSLRGAGVLRSDRAFAQIRTAPTSRSEYQETAIALQQGAAYIARSREYFGQFRTVCVQFAKIQVLELNAAAGTAKLEIHTAINCSDDRLTED